MTKRTTDYSTVICQAEMFTLCLIESMRILNLISLYILTQINHLAQFHTLSV